MALASSATIHAQLPPSGRHSLLVPRASGNHSIAGVAETPHLDSHRRSSSSINLPSTISNLLHFHLHIDKKLEGSAFTLVNSISGDRRTPTFSPKEDISSLLPEIHGRADLTPLLRPLHKWLRREIVKYGELAQATYDAFDFNPFSEYCGSCLYGRHRLFHKLGLGRHGYGVTKYLYAMSHVDLPRWLERSIHSDAWSQDSNWMGYVAVSDDAESRRIGCRDIVVAWRGTVAPTEWLEDVQGKMATIEGDVDGHGEVKVEQGFLSIYTSESDLTRYNKSSASKQVMEEIKRLVHHYKSRGEEVSVTITGHSLGGALALLNAYECASGLPGVPVSVVSFGAPRVGNAAFAERLKQMGVKTLRAVVKQDVVPKMPGVLFNEGLQQRVEKMTGELDWVYTHVGIELGLDVKASPYLKHGSMDLAGFHNLEVYLHLVDGYVGGSELGFRREAKRDVALVNKASGMLREELRIPASWKQTENKGLVCNDHGRWVQPKREVEDIPSPLAAHSCRPIKEAEILMDGADFSIKSEITEYTVLAQQCSNLSKYI